MATMFDTRGTLDDRTGTTMNSMTDIITRPQTQTKRRRTTDAGLKNPQITSSGEDKDKYRVAKKKKKPEPTKPSTKKSEAKIPAAETPQSDSSEATDTEGKKDGKQLRGIWIDGQKYTCISCRNGHRTAGCEHVDKPLIPTNNPGRPAGGQVKKIQCRCPKSCNCAGRCRCETRNCICVQQAYVIVWTPIEHKQNSRSEADQESPNGAYQIAGGVWMDTKGQQLSPEEADRRHRLRAVNTNSKDRTRANSSSTVQASVSPTQFPTSALQVPSKTTVSAITPFPDALSPSQAKPKAAGGCCNHSKKMAETSRVPPQQEQIPKPGVVKAPAKSHASLHGCNCGAACSCAFCPQHPNNAVSIALARHHANLFMQYQLLNANLGFGQYIPAAPPTQSCMGTSQIGVFNGFGGVMPSVEDMARAVPNFSTQDGTLMAYPITQQTASSTNQFDEFHQGYNHDLVPRPVEQKLQSHEHDRYTIEQPRIATRGPNGWHESPKFTEQTGMGSLHWAVDQQIIDLDLDAIDSAGNLQPVDSISGLSTYPGMSSATYEVPTAVLQNDTPQPTPQSAFKSIFAHTAAPDLQKQEAPNGRTLDQGSSATGKARDVPQTAQQQDQYVQCCQPRETSLFHPETPMLTTTALELDHSNHPHEFNEMLSDHLLQNLSTSYQETYVDEDYLGLFAP